MPFDEEEENLQPTIAAQKVSLKKVSTQKSIFDSAAKKPSQEDFENKVHKINEQSFSYKSKAAELVSQFIQTMNDKTLKENKTIFAKEVEKELLANMIKLAVEINNDQNEKEGMGSLSWITLLFKTALSQRDRINKLEYSLSQLEKNIAALTKEK